MLYKSNNFFLNKDNISRKHLSSNQKSLHQIQFLHLKTQHLISDIGSTAVS